MHASIHAYTHTYNTYTLTYNTYSAHTQHISTVHHTALRYVTIHYIALHFITYITYRDRHALHHVMMYYITSYSIFLHTYTQTYTHHLVLCNCTFSNSTVHYITLGTYANKQTHIAFHCSALHDFTLYYITLRFITHMKCIAYTTYMSYMTCTHT